MQGGRRANILCDIQPTSNVAGWDASVPECRRICGTGHRPLSRGGAQKKRISSSMPLRVRESMGQLDVGLTPDSVTAFFGTPPP
jgi:hypothetical protein